MFNAFYFTATDKEFTYGVKDPKYLFHHEGTKNMPSRVVVGINNVRRKKLNDLVIAQIRRVKGKRARSKK
jgi:hypothetical protein